MGVQGGHRRSWQWSDAGWCVAFVAVAGWCFWNLRLLFDYLLHG